MLLQVLFEVEGLPTGWLRAAERLLVDMLVLLVVLGSDKKEEAKGWLSSQEDKWELGEQASSSSTCVSPPQFYHRLGHHSGLILS